MSGDSRSRVTITLGRGGRVVKRAESDTDFLDSSSRGARKPSVRERLGSSSGVPFSNGNGVDRKRQRGDVVSSDIDLDRNGGIGENDLRFKLIQKNAFKRSRSVDEKVTDLRDKILRMGQPPSSTSNVETYQRMHEPRVNAIMGRTPSTRTTHDLVRKDSSRSGYAAWSADHSRRRSPADHSRRRSPESIAGFSRGSSPPRNNDRIQSQGERFGRVYDDVRDAPYMNREMLDAPRRMHSAPFPPISTMPPTTSHLPPHHRTSNPLPPPTIMKPPPSLAPSPFLSRLPPLGNAVQKAPPLVEEHKTIDSLLNSLELGKYSILFKAEEVDMPALKQMGENDLKELGIPMGPRKKILLAIMPSGKRQPR